MPETETATETEAIAELARQSAACELIAIEPGHVGQLIVPEGATALPLDYEQFLPAPRRAAGRTSLHDPDSLVLYVRKHGEGTAPNEQLDGGDHKTRAEKTPTALYADIDKATITAVINGHGPGNWPAGWGDHRAHVTLRYAPEWTHWAGSDRQWLSQVEFGEHLEEGYGEIVEPSAAEMLELAQTMQANNRVDWRSQNVLANGQRQFLYTETINATAGEKGTVTIPQRFKLGLIVFDGQLEGYRVDARFQFRINEGTLKIRYLLVRPHDIVRSAFGDVVTDVETGVGIAAFRGTPPN